MPTLNPRINVTLSPSLDQLVQRMAGHQRVSKSQVLRELLEAAEPALQRAVALMDAAAAAAAGVRKDLARDLDRETQRAEKAAASLLAGMEATTADLVSMAESVRGRRPARDARGRAPGSDGAPRPADPPSSNRGVKSPRKAQERARKGGL